MTKPVLFVTNHAPPFRVGAFATLHEREDVTFALVGGDVRHGGGATEADRCVPGAAGARARRPRAGRVGRLPRGRGRALGPARAARPPTPERAGRACRSSSGRRSGRTRRRPPTRSPTCRCATSTGTPTRSSPTGRTCRPTCARRGRASVSSWPPSRSTTRIGTDTPTRFGALSSKPRLWAESQGKKELKCSSRPGGLRACRHSAPRWFWSAAVRSEPGPSPPARSCPKARAAPPKYATSTPAATLWSYLRSPPATSASRGGWWSTKPSTREFP